MQAVFNATGVEERLNKSAATVEGVPNHFRTPAYFAETSKYVATNVSIIMNGKTKQRKVWRRRRMIVQQSHLSHRVKGMTGTGCRTINLPPGLRRTVH